MRPQEVEPGDILAQALRSILQTIEYTRALDELIEGGCACFADYAGAGSEQRLEWGELHTRYVEVVEAAISEELDSLECSAEELFDYARSVGADAKSDRLLSKLLAMSDYEAFCGVMHAAHCQGHRPMRLIEREMD